MGLLINGVWERRCNHHSYSAARPDYSCTALVLWDRERRQLCARSRGSCRRL